MNKKCPECQQLIEPGDNSAIYAEGEYHTECLMNHFEEVTGDKASMATLWHENLNLKNKILELEHNKSKPSLWRFYIWMIMGGYVSLSYYYASWAGVIASIVSLLMCFGASWLMVKAFK